MRWPAALILVFTSCAPGAPADPERGAAQIVDRSRSTDATYALYLWTWAELPDGSRTAEWTAEFHRDTRHRVETPRTRVVADCAARTGTALDLASGERVTGPQVAGVACGISSNGEVAEMSLIGQRDSRFGKVDIVRILDAGDERLYAVREDGALVAAEIFPRSSTARYCVQNIASAVESRLPEEDIFSPASLDRSVVPARFRSPPGQIDRQLWTSGRRCAGS